MTALALLLGSCSSSEKDPGRHSNLTHGMIKSKVEKGKTTQDEIVRTFGSPNIVTRNKEGLEVWTYSKESSRAKAGSSYGTLLFAGGESAYSNTSTETFDFIVTFDKDDVVQDYSVVSSRF